MKRTRFCRQHLLFWGLSLLTPFISQGQVCSAGKQSYETLLKVSKETLKQSHIGYATSNMADYCQRNFLLRFINSRKKATPDCEAKSTEELEKLALALTVEISDDLLENHPWNFGLIPTEKTAIHALDLSIEHLGYSKENTLPPLERLRKNLEGGTHLRPDKEKQLKNRIDELKATQDL